MKTSFKDHEIREIHERINSKGKASFVAPDLQFSDAEHWEDFDPIMVECATSDDAVLENVARTIPPEEWAQLDEGLKHLPQPLKRGIYSLKLSR